MWGAVVGALGQTVLGKKEILSATSEFLLGFDQDRTTAVFETNPRPAISLNPLALL